METQIKTTVDGAIIPAPSLKEIRGGVDESVGVRMTITPAIATEWLESRGNNRKVSDSVVSKYSLDMKEGRWVFNGAPIQFDEEGKLLNGQHRLWAVIESGCSIDTIVQWGIPRDSQATIDAGAKWTAKDILYMDGEKNTALLQATLRWIFRDEQGVLMSSRGMSNSKAMEILKRHPYVRRSVEFIAGSGRGPMPPSSAAFLHYKVAQADPDKADEFFRRLADGVGLAQGSPILRLRERLQQYTGRGRLHQSESLALAIIAWNAYRAGKELRVLIWRKSGPQAQPFPTIDGAALATTKVQRPRGRPKKSPGVRKEVGSVASVARHGRG